MHIQFDKKLEELPETRENLVALYKIEKAEQIKANENRHYIRERKEENQYLFEGDKNNFLGKINDSVHMFQKMDGNRELGSYFERRR